MNGSGVVDGVVEQEILTEMAPLIKGTIASMEERLRKQIRAELEGEFKVRVEKEVDEALVKYFGQKKGVSQGRLPFSALEDRFAAKEYRDLLTKGSWMPIPMEISEGMEVNGDTVLNSLEKFFLGNPIQEAAGLGSLSFVGDGEQKYVQAMQAAFQKMLMDPHAASTALQGRNYIIGQGVKISCYNENIQDVIHAFWKKNRMDRRLYYAVARKFCGEHYFFHFVDSVTGDVLIRDPIRPWDITHIETHPDDVETRLSYEREVDAQKKPLVYADINYFKQLENAWGKTSRNHARLDPLQFVQQVKYGSLSQVRGVTPLLPALRYYRFWEDFLVDRIILNHERSKVLWVRVVKGSQDIEGGRDLTPPPGGVVLTETPWLEWKTVNAEINAGDVKEDGRIIRLAICAAVGYPEHVIFQDASNQVYASIRSTETPFTQGIRGSQQEWTWDLEDMLAVPIREKVKRGILGPKVKVEIYLREAWNRAYAEIFPMVEENAHASQIRAALSAILKEAQTRTRIVPTEEVPVTIDFPEIVQEDRLKQAQTGEVLQRIKVASRPEIAGWFGLDWREQDQLEQQSGGWPEPKGPGKETSGAPGETTRDTPREPNPPRKDVDDE